MQNTQSQVLRPQLNPRTNTQPPTPFFVCLLGFLFFFFCFLKNLFRLKINILSSIYPEINFPAKPVMKINNLSRPKVPAPPPPLRIKWSSPYMQNMTKHSTRSGKMFGPVLHVERKHKNCASLCYLSNVDIFQYVTQNSTLTRQNELHFCCVNIVY